MRAPAQISNARSYDDFYADEHYISGELSAGERIGPPRRRTGGTAKVWGIFILVAFGGAWAALGDPTTWPVRTWADRLAAQMSAAAPEVDRKAPAQVKRVAPMAAVSPAPPADSLDEAPPLKAPPTPKATPFVAGAIPPAAAGKLPAQPLPPPAVDPADPYQVRAEALGLHPGLSRVLLARLSPTDFRNAGIAIRTALAETPDGAIFVWPRQRAPELALFKVRFVPGAAPNCRRYVVTISKDGWSTTAHPMERCRSQVGRLQRG
jgi:hypothetical protein